MIKRIRTSKLSIKKSLSLRLGGKGVGVEGFGRRISGRERARDRDAHPGPRDDFDHLRVGG